MVYWFSFRFNNQIKHFRLFFDGKNHYVGEKRFDTLHDLVADGLVTMYIELKAGEHLKNIAAGSYVNSPYYTLTKSIRKHIQISRLAGNKEVRMLFLGTLLDSFCWLKSDFLAIMFFSVVVLIQKRSDECDFEVLFLYVFVFYHPFPAIYQYTLSRNLPNTTVHVLLCTLFYCDTPLTSILPQFFLKSYIPSSSVAVHPHLTKMYFISNTIVFLWAQWSIVWDRSQYFTIY